MIQTGAGLALPPVVAPAAQPNNGRAPLDVHFYAHATDVNSNSVLTYSWNFGDPDSSESNKSTLENPGHTYFNAGTYTATVIVSDGINAPIQGSVTINVSSALTIHVTEAEIKRGEHRKEKGNISLKADFDDTEIPTPKDPILVKFGGITLLDAPLNQFHQESAGKYEYETRELKAEIDFNLKKIEVSRHKILTGGLDSSKGIEVVISFGPATGTDLFVISGEHEDCDRDHTPKQR
jgi:hypothetical protein